MLPAAVKNKIEQIWLDVIAGGVSQPTEVIEQLTYLMFAKEIDEREADIETAELLSGEKFFDNKDGVAGAREFFTALGDNGLKDAYLHSFDGEYSKGLPLAVSHEVKRIGPA